MSAPGDWPGPGPEPEVLHEFFFDNHGNAVAKDDPTCTTIELHVRYADGTEERIYASTSSTRPPDLP